MNFLDIGQFLLNKGNKHLCLGEFTCELEIGICASVCEVSF